VEEISVYLERSGSSVAIEEGLSEKGFNVLMAFVPQGFPSVLFSLKIHVASCLSLMVSLPDVSVGLEVYQFSSPSRLAPSSQALD